MLTCYPATPLGTVVRSDVAVTRGSGGQPRESGERAQPRCKAVSLPEGNLNGVSK